MRSKKQSAAKLKEPYISCRSRSENKEREMDIIYAK